MTKKTLHLLTQSLLFIQQTLRNCCLRYNRNTVDTIDSKNPAFLSLLRNLQTQIWGQTSSEKIGEAPRVSRWTEQWWFCLNKSSFKRLGEVAVSSDVYITIPIYKCKERENKEEKMMQIKWISKNRPYINVGLWTFDK